jgi:uncharacterized LabA/DUF88 family protein
MKDVFFQLRTLQMPNSDKVALFIDGPNLYHSTRALGFDIDFKRLLAEFGARGCLLRAYYYTTIVENDESQSMRPLLDWLDYNGYSVTAKLAKEFDDGEGRRKVKRNISIELVVDAIEMAGRVDRIVLFAGDGDFRVLVEAMQRRGVHVTVVSTCRTKPSMIADELRRQTDAFVELDDLRALIGRAQHTSRAREMA